MGKRNEGENQPKLSMCENDIRKPAILNAKIFFKKKKVTTIKQKQKTPKFADNG